MKSITRLVWCQIILGSNPSLPGRWIRRTGCAVGLALWLSVRMASAATDDSSMVAANDAFAQDRFAAAAQGYEAILAHRGYSASVLFNLANARQREGQLGQAILNYERAALLSPHDADIAVNLRAARQNAGVEVKPESALRTAANTLTINAWFGLAAVALFLSVVAWPLKLLRPQARRALNMGGAMAAVAFVGAFTALGLRSTELSRAVVVSEAVAMVSPVTVAEPVFRLQTGEVVTLLKTHGDFSLVANPVGQKGWVKASAIARVIPASTPVHGV